MTLEAKQKVRQKVRQGFTQEELDQQTKTIAEASIEAEPRMSKKGIFLLTIFAVAVLTMYSTNNPNILPNYLAPIQQLLKRKN